MRDVLLVAQSLPPVGGSHATRVLAVARRLVPVGLKMALAPDVGPEYPNRDNSQLEVGVQRTFPGLAHKLAHGRNDRRAGTPSTTKIGGIRVLLAKLSLTAYRRVEFIDSYMDWIPHLALQVRRLTASEKLVVVSMSMPNSTHVGVLLGLLGNRDTPWVADFADPWTLDQSRPRRQVRGFLEREVERAVLRRANVVFFATERTLGDYQRSYPSLAHKMRLARMGFEVTDLRCHARTFRSPTVFYGGALPVENRDATGVFKAIEDLPEIDFVFAGPCVDVVTDYFNRTLPSNVITVAWLSHSEYCEFVRGADAALIFGNSNGQQVPGKVYQVAGLAKRVLYVQNMPLPEDESWACIQDWATLVSPSSEVSAEIRKALALPPPAKSVDRLSWDSAVTELVAAVSELRSL